MDVNARRNEILKILEKSTTPITATNLANRFGVSRQVIVSDISVIRASGIEITALARGYIIEKPNKISKIFKVIHSDEDVERELGLIVDFGGTVDDVFVFHRVYGKICAPMGIKNHADIKYFLAEIASGKSSLLKNVTAGYHYHTVSATKQEILDKIELALKENGFLAPLKMYEPIGMDKNRY